MAGVTAFDPDRYPGPRPDGPVVVHRGDVWPVVVDGTCDTPVRLADRAITDGAPNPARVTVLAALQRVRFSVAYGSNASPQRLVDKGLDRDGALLLPARMADVAPAYELRRTGYGAVPVTLVPDVGRVVDTWVLGIPEERTGRLDASEGRSRHATTGASERDDRRQAPAGSYRLALVGEVAVADRFRLPAALAYCPGPATRIQLLPDGRPRTWPEHDQADARDHLDTAAASGPAPPVGEVVDGAWPATPLADLPLFVYGSLRPGQPAWPAIADDVEVVADAWVAGALYDTGHGWPAAQLTAEPAGTAGTAGTASQVHGVLVAVRDPAAAPTLLRRIDAYEGAPELFVRTTARVHTAQGPRFALAYTWARGTPPGQQLPDGRWPGDPPAAD